MYKLADPKLTSSFSDLFDVDLTSPVAEILIYLLKFNSKQSPTDVVRMTVNELWGMEDIRIA